MTRRFRVVDKRTGQGASLDAISREEWVTRSLVWCDLERFAVTQDASLYLLDETGTWIYAPADRFEIVWTEPTRTEAEE